MKSKLLILAFLLLIAFSGSAQKKAGVSATTPTYDETGRWLMYWATWREWGHLPDCSGWGLCDYSDCWFCDVSDKHKAKVLIDPKTKEGEMLIELDPSLPDEKKAIAGKSVFTISADIDKTNSVLHKGLYNFDTSVGKYGGYILKITLK